ncbi:MAG: DNA translocase FtsK 4TM domain-containing protein, partial [Pirellulales bacterium]
MLENRNVKLDLAALALLAVVVFLGLSLGTYNAADPPTSLVYPAEPVVANACGRLGASAAHLLLSALGVGAYYLVASAAAFDVLLLLRRPVGELALRLVGWSLSLVALTTLAALCLPNLIAGPTIGPGGYLGATGRGLLEMHFATAGAFIFAGSVLIGGLLLCTDYILLRISMWLVGVPAKGLVRAGRAAAARTAAAPKAKQGQRTDLAEGDAAGASPVPIKIAGKATATKTAVADEPDDAAGEIDEEVDAEESDEESIEEEEAEAGGSAVLHRLSAALRIRPPIRKKSDRDEVHEQLNAAASATEKPANYELPPLDLLLESDDFPYEAHEQEVRQTAKVLERTFANFGFKVRVVEIQTGPVIAQYEIELEKGLRLAKITGLADDIAIALRVPSVRIVAPIPGKNTVGIEVPNGERQIVRLREVIDESDAVVSKMHIPIYLGKDVSGHPMVIDLATLPHLLIAGRTGTGKSVCLNSMIISMLMTRRPDEVRMLMIDPKMVELSPYQRLPHLMHPVVTDMGKAEAILDWAVQKMEERYALLARAGVRHIGGYNQLKEDDLRARLAPESEEDWQSVPKHLPYIVIVADEMADLMMTSGKQVEQHIIRLAQKSRAVGIHLILATQKPTVDVITGLIKSNLPARISFQVASRTDSRVVLDEMGADK